MFSWSWIFFRYRKRHPLSSVIFRRAVTPLLKNPIFLFPFFAKLILILYAMLLVVWDAAWISEHIGLRHSQASLPGGIKICRQTKPGVRRYGGRRLRECCICSHERGACDKQRGKTRFDTVLFRIYATVLRERFLTTNENVHGRISFN